MSYVNPCYGLEIESMIKQPWNVFTENHKTAR